MILSTHSVVGAATAYSLTGNPLIAFFIGLLSHFVLDALPHWEYSFSDSFTKLEFAKRSFWIDFLKISIDVFSGFLLVLFFVQGDLPLEITIWVGAFGAILPDALQFLGFNPRFKLFVWFKNFHDRIHCSIDLLDQPFFGSLFQVGLMVIFLFVSL